jgi:hypothetical protein
MKNAEQLTDAILQRLGEFNHQQFEVDSID